MSFKYRVLVSVMGLTVAGCSRLSDVGEQPQLAPTAVAQVVGYAGADASGNSAATIRAHSEVLLTGKESIEADKPILGFLWEAENPAAKDALITVRNTSTINVSVPEVSQATDMVFKLTVTDSDNDTDTSLVTLHVQPVLDANRFLTYLSGQSKLRLVAATRQPSDNGGSFDLELRASVKYVTRSSTLGNIQYNTVNYRIGKIVQGNWLPLVQTGPDLGVNDPRNPVFEFVIPAVNLDDIIREIQDDFPASQSKFPNPAFIDMAEIEVIATLTSRAAIGVISLYAPGAVDAQGAPLQAATNGGTGTEAQLHLPAVTLDKLRLSSGGIENAVTAKAYYDAIDQGNPTPKETLTEWLTQNCFKATAADYGADAHALYVNNFDLGFGRDMYFIGTKPAGCTSATFGAGNAASVVINYPTLEAAAKKVDPVIAVAMEYRNVDSTRATPGTVVFYIFAPDSSTGEFRRVMSANFDGRGEKYLPGACTMCHGGKPKSPPPNPAATYVTAADTDIGATFMPWDLESFLFTDNDPSFPADPANAALHAQFTRAKQESEFKKLNLGALGTYSSRNGAVTTCHQLFTGPCDLVKLWYGDDLASATFLNGKVGRGWSEGGTNVSVQAVKDLYTNVFARNCRACHTQRVVNAQGSLDLQFQNYADFVSTTPPAQAPDSPSVRDRILNQVFGNGVMPGARLTADRFWVPVTGATTSAADALANHLGVPPGTKPGSALPCLDSTPGMFPTLTEAQSHTIQRRLPDEMNGNLGAFTKIDLDAGCSSFARSFEWLLTKPDGSSAVVAGGNTSRASFSVDTWGDFAMMLRVTGSFGDTSTATRYVTVPDLHPTAVDVPLTVPVNVPGIVNVLAQTPMKGDRPTIVNPQFEYSRAGLSARIVGQQQVEVTSTQIVPGTVTYSITDVDGGAVNTDAGVINVTVSADINVNSETVADVVAESTTEIPLSTRVVVPAGQAFSVQLWQRGVPGAVVTTETTSLPARIGNGGGSVTLVSCSSAPFIGQTCAQYVAPKRTITKFGTIILGDDDSFAFRACFQADPNRCSTVGVITVPIGGQAGFSSVASLLNSVGGCATCHSTTPPVNNPGPGNGANWTVQAGATPTAVFTAVRCAVGVSPNANDVDDPLVNLENPGDSLLYLKPGGGASHTGGVRIPDPLDRQKILDWITEGGYFTDSAVQPTQCP